MGDGPGFHGFRPLRSRSLRRYFLSHRAVPLFRLRLMELLTSPPVVEAQANELHCGNDPQHDEDTGNKK